MTFEVRLGFNEVVEAIRLYLEQKQPELMQGFYVSDVFREDYDSMCSIDFLEVDLEPISETEEGSDANG